MDIPVFLEQFGPVTIKSRPPSTVAKNFWLQVGAARANFGDERYENSEMQAVGDTEPGSFLRNLGLAKLFFYTLVN